MSQFALYREPIVLDFIKHRHLKLAPPTDHTMASGLHACFLATAEFVQAARDYVIVFVHDDVEGRRQWQPIVLLGVTAGENLFVEAAAGSMWDARYVPAYVRRYPFWITQIDGQEMPAVMIDKWWSGFSEIDGDPLYVAENQPAPRLAAAIAFMEEFEREVARTMLMCGRLVELDLLREMSANVTLPDGKTLALNGFFTVDEAKLQALPDAQVIELHRNGILGLLHAHLSSLGNLQSLLERKARRMAGPAH